MLCFLTPSNVNKSTHPIVRLVTVCIAYTTETLQPTTDANICNRISAPPKPLKFPSGFLLPSQKHTQKVTNDKKKHGNQYQYVTRIVAITCKRACVRVHVRARVRATMPWRQCRTNKHDEIALAEAGRRKTSSGHTAHHFTNCHQPALS